MTTTEAPSITRRQISRMLDKMRSIKIRHASRIVARDLAVEAAANRYAKDIAADEAELLQLNASISRWAVDNRVAEFGEAKSLVFPSGATVQFRWKPKSFAFDFGWLEEKVIAALKRRKLGKFIRVSESIDRAALIKAVGDTIPVDKAKAFGVVISQEESVSVTIPMATAGKENKA
jgi:phage host-nuclease inhibitor protein Gam